MNIKVKQKDILDYILGNTNYDPIEKIIDPTKYEVFDVSIYDTQKKIFYGQSSDYLRFCARVSLLRRSAKDFSLSELAKYSQEVELSAPKEINLTEPLSDNQ